MKSQRLILTNTDHEILSLRKVNRCAERCWVKKNGPVNDIVNNDNGNKLRDGNQPVLVRKAQLFFQNSPFLVWSVAPSITLSLFSI